MRVCALALVIGTLAAQDEPIGWQAEAAEKRGDVVRAWTLYSQAAAFDPTNRKYLGKTISLRSAALDKSKIAIDQGDLELEPLDPSIVRTITPAELVEVARLKPPPDLKPSSKRQNFDFQGPARQVIERTMKACGLDVVFDSTFDVTASIHLNLDDTGCAEAIHAMELLSGAFIVPISEKVALVARDTPDKRRDQERTVAIMVPLDEPVTIQEAQEVGRGVQTLFEIQKFAIDSVTRMVLFRDRYSKVRPARMLFEQLLLHRPQVMIDVEFIQLNNQRDTSLGFDLPSMTQIVNFGGLLNSKPNIMPAFTKFLTFGGGLTLFGLGITDSTAFASMTESRVQVFQQATMRSLDGQAATLHVGDRFPIITQSYSNGSTSQTPSSFIPAPTIQFEDLGLTLKITPRVHGTEEITLAIESEFKVLTGQASNGIPVIANRKFQGQIRLRDGEWAIAAGLATSSDSSGYTGIAGLSQIPGVGTVLRKNTLSKSSGQLMLVFKPRIINTAPDEGSTKDLWVGSETKPLPPI